MKKILCDTYKDMSKQAAQLMIDQVRTKPDSVLGLATGSSPIGMYEELVAAYQAGKVDFSKAKSFNLDEYYIISNDNDQSYHYFMNQHLFRHVNFLESHVPDGSAPDADQECAAYDNMIEAAGGIDLQVLGIGPNGHIGFNEPDTFLYAGTHKTGLSQKTIQANARFFPSIDDVPKMAITMGMGNILKARKIILLITGSNKREVADAIFNGKITCELPASFLQLHPDTTVFIDQGIYQK